MTLNLLFVKLMFLPQEFPFFRRRYNAVVRFSGMHAAVISRLLRPAYSDGDVEFDSFGVYDAQRASRFLLHQLPLCLNLRLVRQL